MSAEPETDLRERLGRALSLLQATPFPLDLVDNPARTGQWLATLGNLSQVLTLLRVQPQPQPGVMLAAPTAYETRGEGLIRAFHRMIEGLPLSCLGQLSPVIKLGLIWPLLRDLEALERRLLAMPLAEVAAYLARLAEYRRDAALMASRHVAPDPPHAGPPLRPAASIPVP
ncbi:MAG: hypothetical protein VW600_13820 [Ferrovibrio sp.]